jgi:hypothetical protein
MSIIKTQPKVTKISFSVPVTLAERLAALERLAKSRGSTIEIDAALSATLTKLVINAENELQKVECNQTP